MQSQRSRSVVETSSICQDRDALGDPKVQAIEDLRAITRVDCPLMGPCYSGQLRREGVRCAALTGHIMARSIAAGNPLAAELQELAKAPVFYPMTSGFIDPYSETPRDTEKDKNRAIGSVVKYASLVLYSNETSLKLDGIISTES